jgi:taurine transport system substrate-binding protein
MNRRLTISATLAIAAVGLAGCVDSGRDASGSGGSEQAECPWEADDSVTTTARIAWQKVPTADLIVKDRGVLEACMPEASVTWSNFASGGDVLQAYGGQSVDMGLVGSSPTTIALTKGQDRSLPIEVVWIHDIIGEAEALVVRDESATSIKDLEGGTIAVPFASTSHYSLLQALDEAGMDSNTDVKLINLEPDKMQSAFEGDQIDGAWVWNPVLDELKKSGKVVTSSADTAEFGTATYDLGTVTTSFAEENPEFMDQWAKAQDYAVTMIREEPDKAAESIGVQLGRDPGDVEPLFDQFEFLSADEQASDDYLGGQLGVNLHETAGFLVQQGSITKASPETVYEDGVTPAFADSVNQ